jgi:GNAT superfamily N-acetyltransferase
MDHGTINIQLMGDEHVSEVVKLHIENLPTDFTGFPGEKLLSLYYDAIIHGSGAVGYILCVDRQMMGYVCGIWDDKRLNSFLYRQHGFALLFWSICQTIVSPKWVKSLAPRISGKPENLASLPGYELRPIVINSAVRSMGYGSDLVSYLRRDAQKRGFDRIYLCVENENQRAQNFYLKNGFHFFNSFDLQGKTMLIFESSMTEVTV